MTTTNSSEGNGRNNYQPFTVTNGRAFINEFRHVAKPEGQDMYFASIGFITGKVGKGDSAKPQVQYLDLLVSDQMMDFAAYAVGTGKAKKPYGPSPKSVTLWDVHVTVNGEYLKTRGILSDVSMSSMDALKFAAHIRQQEEKIPNHAPSHAVNMTQQKPQGPQYPGTMPYSSYPSVTLNQTYGHP